jgi:hypothetical protein
MAKWVADRRCGRKMEGSNKFIGIKFILFKYLFILISLYATAIVYAGYVINQP